MSNEMVPVPEKQNAGAIVTAMGFGSIGGQMLTSLDLTTERGKQLLMSAIAISFPKLDTVLNNPVDIVDYLVSPAELASEESGEIVRVPLTRLFLADGQSLQTTAPAVLKTLIAYNDMIRNAPWYPPFRVIPRSVQSGGARKYYILEPVFSAPETEKKGKGK